MANTLVCVACKAPIPADDRCCPHCGVVQLVKESIMEQTQAVSADPGGDQDVTVPLSSDLLACVSCSALLPAYAKYCLVCGASQSGLPAQALDPIEPEQDKPSHAAMVPATDAQNCFPDLQVSAPEPEPEPEQDHQLPEREQDRLIREIRNQHKKIDQDISALEVSRYWWR